MFHIPCIEIFCLCVGGILNNTIGKPHFYCLYLLPSVMNFQIFVLFSRSRFPFKPIYGIVFNQAQLTHFGSRLKKVSETGTTGSKFKLKLGLLGKPIHSDTCTQLNYDQSSLTCISE